MKNRISLDDPNYDNSKRVVIQDNKAKAVWAVLGTIAVILIITAFTMQSKSGSGNSNGEVKHGMYFDYYDDNGDGWVDRMYSYDINRWFDIPTGNLSMDQAE